MGSVTRFPVEIPQMVASFIANGKMETEFIPVESEHSAICSSRGTKTS